MRGWKEEFFFLESSAPWPCPVEWGEPSRSSTMDPALTVEEKAVAEKLLCARGSSPIDLSTYLHNRNMAAAKIIGAPSRPPTPQGAPVVVATEDILAEKAATAAAARASAGKVTVKSEPDCKAPPCALSLGKRRKLEKDPAVDGESSASDPSCPPGFSSTRWKPPSGTSKDGEERQCALQQHRDGCCRAPSRRPGGASSPPPSRPTSSPQATCHCYRVRRRRTRWHSRWGTLWSWRRS
ncbi:uncharacterized protein [Triticum aestivum]|uniref:uncharacterized protein n=1 Tax=Triticum aestivum TaxID=4565 RepID=UPI001D01691B|nr:uncharacterized protein LOC123167573 [Triticum aestivum]